jgi:hypothetical protein
MTSEWWIGKDVEEMVVPNLKYYPIVWLEELMKNMINLAQDCQCLHVFRLQIRNTTAWANLLGNLVVEWRQYIVMDVINILPGNSSVNTVQHATIEEAVVSVSAVTSRSGGCWSCDMCFLWCVSIPRLYKWQNSFSSGTSQFSAGDSHGKFVVEEEYKKSACEDFTCD